MTILNNFIILKPYDKFLVLKTYLYSCFIRLMLWVLPFSRVTIISKEMGKWKISNSENNIKKIIWSINVTDPYVIKSTCLSRAITAQILLSQNEYTSKIKIGVNKKDEFQAHAWVEVDGDVIIGKSEKKYVTIVDL
jgi:hypothetical protein